MVGQCYSEGLFWQAQRRALRHAWLAPFLGVLLFGTVSVRAEADLGCLVRVWDVEHGLPQSSVTDIAQTSDGYLWIGTLHSGLARFDGLQFECFDLANTPQLGHTGVRRLLGDAFGRLWVNTYAPGLLVMEGGVLVGVEARSPQLDALLVARTNEAVFSTVGNHLYRLERSSAGAWNPLLIRNATTNPVVSYVGAADGTIWYRRSDGRLGRFEENHFTDLTAIPGWSTPQVRALLGDRDGRVWIQGEERAAWWDGVHFRDATPTNGEPLVGLLRITPTTQGAVWLETATSMRLAGAGQWLAQARNWDGSAFGARRMGSRRVDAAGGLWTQVPEWGLLHLWPDGRFEQVTRQQGLLSTAVTCMFGDKDGNFWAGYARGGLISVRRRLFRTIGRPEGLGDTLVSSVCADRNGAVWLGSAGGEVSRWWNGKLTTFTLPQLGNRCLGPLVAPAQDGRVWVATDGNGLLVYEHSAFQHKVRPEQFPAGPRALLVDRAQRVWVGAFGGLFALEDGHWELVQAIRRPGEYPGALAEGADGSIWVGTFNGELWHLAGPNLKLTRFKLPYSGTQNFVTALQADADGSLWVGTQGGGLLHWKDGVVGRFTSAEGLPEDRIWQLVDDQRGGLWVGTGAGIVRLDKAQLLESPRRAGKLIARRFGPSDGLQSASGTPEFKPNCWRSADGCLWFATANGVVTVDPAAVTEEHRPPAAVLEAVAVGGQSRPIGPALRRPGARLTVGPGSQSLEFRYTALDFMHPELVRFRARLLGLDKDWIEAGPSRQASYRHVPPGHYTFQVSACNAAGVWNPVPAELFVAVQPHFWQTGWFLGLGAAGLAAGLAGAVRYVSFRRLRARLARLEQEAALQQERARIAKDIHDDIGASLTEIALLSELAQKRLETPPLARGHIDQIFQKARAVTRAIDDIVWSFNPSNDSVEGLVQHLGKFAPEFLTSAGIRCRMDVPIELPAVPLPSRLRHHLFLAMKEALHNIVKHSGATEVWVRVQPEEHQLCISIEDNGRGFAASGPAAAEADGLANMRQRMSEVAGRFVQSSREGSGTTTTLTVPLVRP